MVKMLKRCFSGSLCYLCLGVTKTPSEGGDVTEGLTSEGGASLQSSLYVALGTSCRRWYKLVSVPKKKKIGICGEFCLKVHTEVLKLQFGVVSDNRETSTSLRHAETFSVGLRCQFPS